MPQIRGDGKPESEYVRRRKAVRALRIPGAGPTERAVFATLLERLPRIFAAEEVLAAEAWCSVRTLRRAVGFLSAAGVVEIDRRGHRGRFGATNEYRIVWNRVFDLADPGLAVPVRLAGTGE